MSIYCKYRVLYLSPELFLVNKKILQSVQV